MITSWFNHRKQEAVKNDDNAGLRYDLAELQMRLKQFEKAERTVGQALERDGQGNDLNSLMTQARFLTLMASIQERSGASEASLRTLDEVKDMRSRVLKRVQVEQPDAVAEQRKLAAKSDLILNLPNAKKLPYVPLYYN